MTGGLLSILSYGSTDLFLTGAPQITFFKVVYRRHTNFSIESIEVGLNTNVNFNDEYEITIDRTGDLIGKTYLKIALPEVYFNRTELGLSLTENTSPDIELSNYNKVYNFMLYNMNAYRASYKNQLVKNISTTKFLTDISNNYIDQNQHKALDEYNNLIDTYKNTNSYIYALLYNANIYNIYLKYKNTPDNSETVTVSFLFNLVESAKNTSFKCQQYFWNVYNTKLNEYNLNIKNNLKFAWNPNIGHNIIDHIDVRLGGEQIDRHYGDYYESRYQIRKKNNLDNVYNQLIGNLEELTTYNENPKPQYYITVPLDFWFNKNMGSAFPLVASQYSDLSFRINLKNINLCGLIEQVADPSYQNTVYYTLEDLWNDKNYKLEISLLVDYIFLDGIERRKFAQSSHEYLIENIQTVTELISSYTSQINTSSLTNDSIINNSIPYNVKLNLKHPCKQIIWNLQKIAYISDNGGTKKTIFNNYSLDPSKDIDSIVDCNILLNGYEKFKKKLGTAKYLNLVQSYQHNTNIPLCGLYTYSFAIFPEELQPSSSCNFSRFLSQTLQLDIDENMFYYKLSDIDPTILVTDIDNTNYNYTDLQLNLYAISYNVIRISGGFAALAFSFS